MSDDIYIRHHTSHPVSLSYRLDFIIYSSVLHTIPLKFSRDSVQFLEFESQKKLLHSLYNRLKKMKWKEYGLMREIEKKKKNQLLQNWEKRWKKRRFNKFKTIQNYVIHYVE